VDHCLGVQDESSSPSLVASTLFSGNQHSVIGAFAAVHSSTETETRATAEVASAVARFIDPSAVAYTYVSGGGRATFDDYYAAFALGFVVGTTIASVYQSFWMAGQAVAARAAARTTEAPSARSVKSGVRPRLAAEEYLKSGSDGGCVGRGRGCIRWTKQMTVGLPIVNGTDSAA